MSDLPDGWAWTTLGEIAEWGNGGTPKSDNPRYYGPGYQWAVIGDLNDGPITRTYASITPEAIEESAAKIIPAGAVLVAMYGSIGKLGIATEAMSSNQAIAFACVDRYNVESKYLFWYLRSQREDLNEAGKGATQQNISQSLLKYWPIPVPPLAEQHRIVAALERQLANVASGVTEINSALATIRNWTRAARNRLVNGVDGGDNSVPDGWRIDQLSEVLDGIEAGKSFACENRPAREEEWGVVKVSSMTWGEFKEEENKAVPDSESVNQSYEIRPGDLLVSRANTPEYVGAPVLVGNCRRGLLLSDKSLRLHLSSSSDARWLIAVLSSPSVRRQISGKSSGSKDSMRNISQKALMETLIPIPPESARARIAEQNQLLESRSADLQSLAFTALARADHLRQSLLREAFAGRLVPQDPDDEPASVVLERIRAQRGSASKTKAPRKKPATKSRSSDSGRSKEIDSSKPLPEASGKGTQDALELDL